MPVLPGRGPVVVGETASSKLDRTGGVMSGNLDMDGNIIVLDPDGDSSIGAPNDDIVEVRTAGGLNFQFDDPSQCYKRIQMRDGVELIFGSSGNSRIRWDAAETNPMLKEFPGGAHVLGRSASMGQDDFGATVLPFGYVARADDATIAHRVEFGHDGANGFLNTKTGALLLDGALGIKEITTPASLADYGKIYPKADNKLYFQDGAGVEHEVTLGAPSASGEAFFYAYRGSAFNMASNNTWFDFPFDIEAPVKKNVTHDHTSDPDEITIDNAGTYRIEYSVVSQRLAGQVGARLLDDGVEILGSWKAVSNNGNNQECLVNTVERFIGAGSVIKLQVGTDTAGMDIVGFKAANSPAPTAATAATINILKISGDVA